jgi:hypothetical protein
MDTGALLLLAAAEINIEVGNLADTYQDTVIDKGHQPVLLMLVAFGVTFGITRFITHAIRSERFSWLGNVEAGDTHIHHLVWGIVLLLITGLLAVAVQPPLEVTAVVFGIGAALTLDEFALWLHLEDVYWSEQGRQSIDAVIVFAVVSGFMVLGAYPVTIGTTGSIADIAELLAVQAVGLTFCVVCFLKGKLMWGVIGVYFWPVALIGAWRLAKPDSSWARKRYDEAKLARAHKRYAGEKKIHKPALAES